MLNNISHGRGVQFKEEIQFHTPFDYMFPELVRDDEYKLIPSESIRPALLQLANAMADPGTQGQPDTAFDSDIPAIFTYLGQFIDHDITANTDREQGISQIANEDGSDRRLTPLDPNLVIQNMTNGRRPHLDLDSVYGDGPGLLGSHGPAMTADRLYDEHLRLKVYESGHIVDLPRGPEGVAIIADKRNDENVMISQLHTAFLKFHNVAAHEASGSDEVRYVRARQLTCWAYQAVVANDYLTHVCNPNIVADTLANGPRFFSPAIMGGTVFMPLEFSVAAFRFGHSMIRPFYKLNHTTTSNIEELLEAKRHIDAATNQLSAAHVVDWHNFVSGSQVQHTRRIDSKLAQGLLRLPNKDFGMGILSNLAQRNLLRGYLLSLPTGQAVSRLMGIEPLDDASLLDGESHDVRQAFEAGGFKGRTPLWYYLLKEAQQQTAGNTLGAAGSRIVAETLIGLLKQSPNSYLNARDPQVAPDGVTVAGKKVNRIQTFLEVAGVL